MREESLAGEASHTGTRIVAIVADEAEAQAMMRAGGIGLLACDVADAVEPPGLGLHVRLEESEAKKKGALPDGAAGVILDTGSARLLDRFTFAELADLATRVRAKGLTLGLAGALEAPDLARLLPLAPAFFLVREAVRDREGRFDRAAAEGLVALLDPAAPAMATSAPDRVFIRDFVQEMEVGAYSFERGRTQAVRFSLEAELAPVRGRRSLADIYSYDRMMDAVRALREQAPEPFVETLAERLASEMLADPRVEAVTVRVEKLDLGPASAGVEIRRTRRE